MAGYTPLWIEINREAELLRELSKKTTNDYKATLLRLGSLLLEELAEAFFTGRINSSTLEKALILERLYRHNMIPEEVIIRKYRLMALRLLNWPSRPPETTASSRRVTYIIGL